MRSFVAKTTDDLPENVVGLPAWIYFTLLFLPRLNFRQFCQ